MLGRCVRIQLFSFSCVHYPAKMPLFFSFLGYNLIVIHQMVEARPYCRKHAQIVKRWLERSDTPLPD
jgi:hypothetical protein